MRSAVRFAGTLILIGLIAGMTADASDSDPWLVYTHQEGSFSLLATELPDAQLVDQPSCFLKEVPASWQVRASLRTDLNHDGEPGHRSHPQAKKAWR